MKILPRMRVVKLLTHYKLEKRGGAKLAKHVRRGKQLDKEILEVVRGIIEDVKRKGDLALIDATKRYDGVDLSQIGIRVESEEFTKAYDKVSGKQVSALEKAKMRIKEFSENQIEGLKLSYTAAEGLEVRTDLKPIGSVGCYIPGGQAAYPSSVLMTAVPASVAGVKRVVVCSPPLTDGLNPLVLVACDICGVKEVYKVGGAQAIAALAYGTESIRPVLKIVGAGNIFVTYAKMEVSRDVAVDMPAGPSEILVFADEGADARLIALDLAAQAEHAASSICGLVTTSSSLLKAVEGELEDIVGSAHRREVVERSLKSNGFAVIAEEVDDCVDFVNEFAPEHLEIFADEPRRLAERVTSAGLILLGAFSPAAATDYGVGPNHILPTGGYARVASGLSVLDFVKMVNVVECTPSGLKAVAEDLVTIAEGEGLYGHALSIKERVKKIA
ncbi:MAG: histidinol dehydrogenase [Nitrososphaerales archaeon]